MKRVRFSLPAADDRKKSCDSSGVAGRARPVVRNGGGGTAECEDRIGASPINVRLGLLVTRRMIGMRLSYANCLAALTALPQMPPTIVNRNVSGHDYTWNQTERALVLTTP